MAARQRLLCNRRTAGHLHQPEQPVPHLAIQQGKHARKERADPKDQRPQRPDQQRTGTQLHHGLELRHWRNLDAARAQHQGRSQPAPVTEQDSHGKGQHHVCAHLSGIHTILGRTARHKRSRICGRLCAYPFLPGTVHCQGCHEMVSPGCHNPEHPAFVGKELHGIHRLFP